LEDFISEGVHQQRLDETQGQITDEEHGTGGGNGLVRIRQPTEHQLAAGTEVHGPAGSRCAPGRWSRGGP
jgi:hypothetical protein